LSDSNRITSFDKGIPSQKWIEPALWNRIVEYLPIACVDLIFEREDGRILYGYRIIEPYKNVWALIGGRILIGESLKQAARRIAREYGLAFSQLFEIGVSISNFRIRSTITVALAAVGASEEPVLDGKEFSKFTWTSESPRTLGRAYRGMIAKWKLQKASKEILSMNRLE
jgi:ADP-ribose pyrophosphatase YjhB (NUDIX family)